MMYSWPLPQAQTKEVREMWTAEVRRLLEAQFTLMKGQIHVLK